MEVDWSLLGQVLVKFSVAYALALPIGWNRERAQRHAGLRTFPLVAIASCGYILLAIQVLADSEEAEARVIQGMITGMGFIGGGAILKREDSVSGTSTAASLWSTGVIGAAVAYGLYAVALVISAMNLVTFLFLTPLRRMLDRRSGVQPSSDEEDAPLASKGSIPGR